MKIKLRILFYGETRAQAARDPEVAAAVALDAPNWIDADSALAQRISALTGLGKDLWITPDMEFTAAEAGKSAFFQFVCRKTVRESEADRKLNRERLQARPFFGAGTRSGARVRFLDQVCLGRLALRPNEIAHLDEWTEDYVIPLAMEEHFRRAGLTGFEGRAVHDPKRGKEYADYRLLYSESLFPPAAADISFKRVPEDGLGLRQLGCLAYDHALLGGLPDFNRSAEPWYSNDMPAWLVSARVVAAFKACQGKGLVFKPVLDLASPLYAEYLRKWEAAIRLYPDLNRSPGIVLRPLPGP